MSPSIRATCLAAVACSAALLVATTQWVAGRQAGVDRRSWKDYGGAPDNARFVTFPQITKANVASLQTAWTYPMGDGNASVFSPVVVDRVMFVVAKNSSLVALDAATGAELWIHANLNGIAPRGINYWESADRSDRRLIFQRNNYLEAIDAATGQSILTFGVDGAVNLRENPTQHTPRHSEGRARVISRQRRA